MQGMKCPEKSGQLLHLLLPLLSREVLRKQQVDKKDWKNCWKTRGCDDHLILMSLPNFLDDKRSDDDSCGAQISLESKERKEKMIKKMRETTPSRESKDHWMRITDLIPEANHDGLGSDDDDRT